LENTGDGTKRRIYLGIIEADKRQSEEEKDNNYTIKLYDEPDTSLHYSAEVKLFSNLRIMSKRKNTQVIIATHSITMANQVTLSALILFLMNYEERQTKINYVSEEMNPNNILENLGNLLGIDNISYYYTKCFIFVEGKTEKTALPLLFEKYSSEPLVSYGISIIEYSGSHLQCLIEFINKHLHKYIIICDSDKEDDKYFKKIKESLPAEKIFYIGNKEFEDLFSNSLIAKVLNELYPKNTEKWQESEISTLRNLDNGKSFLKNLQDEVYTKTGINFDKASFALKLGEQCEPQEIPEKIQEIFKKAIASTREE